MKFFFPLATSEEQAERIHDRIALRLKAMGYVITLHRVAKVTFCREGIIISETVGATSDNGEIVLAIFKNDIGYFVCTYSRGGMWGEPLVVRYTTVKSAEFFDEPTTHLTEPG